MEFLQSINDTCLIGPPKNESGNPEGPTFFVGTGEEPVMARFLSNDWKNTLQKIFRLKFRGLILILLH